MGYKETIEETVRLCNQAEKRAKKVSFTVRFSESDGELFEAAKVDSSQTTLNGWMVSTLRAAAKSQLGIYDVCDFENYLQPFSIATREQYEAHLEECRTKQRAWSWLDGKRVVIR